ncbi:MAG TPA: hypothetical protein VIU15_02985 [Streptomyces sp.]
MNRFTAPALTTTVAELEALVDSRGFWPLRRSEHSCNTSWWAES